MFFLYEIHCLPNLFMSHDRTVNSPKSANDDEDQNTLKLDNKQLIKELSTFNLNSEMVEKNEENHANFQHCICSITNTINEVEEGTVTQDNE